MIIKLGTWSGFTKGALSKAGWEWEARAAPRAEPAGHAIPRPEGAQPPWWVGFGSPNLLQGLYATKSAEL